MRKEPRRTNQLHGNIESLEARLAMTASPLAGLASHEATAAIEPPGLTLHAATLDAPPPLELHAIDAAPPLELHDDNDVPPTGPDGSLPDFWRDADDGDAILDRQIEQLLSSAHDSTGWNNVVADYGFDGRGQTVVVIDSGVAYDHVALGGGFGTGYRVVGGWDFTEENDANPYDDANTAGTSASHGTHIAGIIGSDDATHRGVAPGVDLVALRVFNDGGAGYFHWVESALDWVHANRNAFEHPITAVNLSLGVSSWNASSVPSWANLEEEFAQLEQDGIVTTVSAGNAFTSYNVPGLSYPAASPYVIPVMSADDNGSLSYYSQRHTTAIAAPGRGIVSTVPDYKGDGNGVADDFRSKSGTSMAAPYLAGASVLIREAMEFVGQTGITQDVIYDHIKATADTLFDSATNLSYDRLNLEAAIDALMPADDYGSTTESAHDLGTIDNDAEINLSGVISTLDDVDYFTFTAAGDGEVTFAASSTSHDLTAQWTVLGGTWQADGENCVLTVSAGQTYSVGLSSSDGLGYFDLDVTAATSESSMDFVDWGVVDQRTVSGVNVDGDGWYRVEASRDAYLSVQSNYNPASGNVTLEVYAADGTTLLAAGASRVDVDAAAGQQYYVRAVGTNASVNFTVTNLVSQSGDVISLAGTAGDDQITFHSGDTHQIEVNGVLYSFQTSTASTIVLAGGGGTDHATVSQTGGVELTISGIESVTDYDASAHALNADLGLTLPANTFEDWGGWGEKWVVNSAGKWHFITPEGDLYRWDGANDLSSSTQIATLTSAYHADLTLLTDAVRTSFMTAQEATLLDGQLGFATHKDGYFLDWAGFDEKWVLAGNGKWYFVTPDGNVYRWNNATSLGDVPLVASLDASYYADPTRLCEAFDGTSPQLALAQSLDASLELARGGSYFENWGGWNEKWLKGPSNEWYVLTESGGLYLWDGRDLTASPLVAAVDPLFHRDPSLLHEAAPGPAALPLGVASVVETATLQTVLTNDSLAAQADDGDDQQTAATNDSGAADEADEVHRIIDAAFSVTQVRRSTADYAIDRDADEGDSGEGQRNDFDAAFGSLEDEDLSWTS